MCWIYRFYNHTPLAKDRGVLALGNLEDQRLRNTVRGEVLLQFLPCLGNGYPDNIVSGGIVIGLAVENTAANFLFMNFRIRFPHCPIAYIEQKISNALGVVDLMAPQDTLQERMALLCRA